MKRFKSVSRVAVLCIFFLGASPSIKGFESSRLLTTADFAAEENDRQQGPTLSSANADPNPWATYNQWMCFDTQHVQLEPVQIKFDTDWKPWPQITVTTSEHRFLISPETDLHLNTEELLAQWKKLFEGSREICIYSAFLQYVDEEDGISSDSLWVLEKLKTENGYWDITQSEAAENELPEPLDPTDDEQRNIDIR